MFANKFFAPPVYPGTIRRITGEDSPVPLGPAAEHVVLTETKVEVATRALLATL